MLFTSVFTALVTVAVAIPTGPVAVRSADKGTPAKLGARTEGIYDSNTRMQTPQTPHPLIKWPPYSSQQPPGVGLTASRKERREAAAKSFGIRYKANKNTHLIF